MGFALADEPQLGAIGAVLAHDDGWLATPQVDGQY